MVFLKALFGKIQLYAIGLLIVYSLSMTGLYLHSQNTSVKLTARLQEASEALKEEVIAREKDKKGYEQDLALLGRDWASRIRHTNSMNDLVGQIKDLERDDCVEGLEEDVPLKSIENNQDVKQVQKPIAKLDSNLPLDFKRLLDQAYQDNQGSGDTTQ